MAPEISEQKSYNNKIDIYSCGILLYEMFENKRYILGENFTWFYTPKKIKELILNNMLCKDAEERYSSLDLLKTYNKL